MFMKREKKGFTLIELLVVIAIIGILATIVLVSLNSARQKARDTRRISDVRQVALALEMYYDDFKWYPKNAAVNTCSIDNWVTMTTALQAGYMTAVPTDPTIGQAAGGYMYGAGADGVTGPQKYTLKAALEKHNTANDTDVDGNTGPGGCDCGTQGAAELFYCVVP